MPISFDKKIIFIHIPKNAGTTVTKEFNMAEIGHHTPDYYMVRFPTEWNTFKKYAIIRNPWDRVVSCFEYAKMEETFWHSKSGITGFGTGNGPNPDSEILKDATFEECIELLKSGQLKHQGWNSQHIYTHVNGEMVLDVLQPMESISKDLPTINPSNRRDYREYYTTPALIDAVGDIYKKDIELFGFTYE
tara:strand:+ start:450 stop:1019 length:570 start_codon:yes stop_codon:yes gene_type:complete